MAARLVRISGRPPLTLLRGPVRALRAGSLLVIPTETVYGLGANALDPDAVQRIFEAKGRPATNPLIVHVANESDARALAESWPEQAGVLAHAFWPGPLTLVVYRNRSVPDIVTAGGPTVALRVPDHFVALSLLEAAHTPIAAPSANPSGQVSPTRVEHLSERIRQAAAYILDAGPCPGGIESTVVDLTGPTPRILRPGLLGRDQIESLIGPLLPADASARHSPEAPSSPNPGEAARSPGVLGRHYAPRARVLLIERTPSSDVQAFFSEGGAPLRIGWLALRDRPDVPTPCHVLRMPTDPEAYARELYDTLQRLDEVGLDVIAVDLPPDEAAWEAVRDRLRRASMG